MKLSNNASEFFPHKGTKIKFKITEFKMHVKYQSVKYHNLKFFLEYDSAFDLEYC